DDTSHPYSLYPADYTFSNMIVAAAVDASGNLAQDSNWGPVHVNLGAPADPTSYAAGYTSGVVGAVAALVSPTATASPRANLITQPAHPDAALAGATTTGGVISPANAVRAVTASPASTSQATAVDLSVFYNRVGMTNDANPAAGNIDGWASSYSA